MVLGEDCLEVVLEAAEGLGIQVGHVGEEVDELGKGAIKVR